MIPLIQQTQVVVGHAFQVAFPVRLPAITDSPAILSLNAESMKVLSNISDFQITDQFSKDVHESMLYCKVVPVEEVWFITQLTAVKQVCRLNILKLT